LRGVLLLVHLLPQGRRCFISGVLQTFATRFYVAVDLSLKQAVRPENPIDEEELEKQLFGTSESEVISSAGFVFQNVMFEICSLFYSYSGLRRKSWSRFIALSFSLKRYMFASSMCT
jgi:hypothetical protein